MVPFRKIVKGDFVNHAFLEEILWKKSFVIRK